MAMNIPAPVQILRYDFTFLTVDGGTTWYGVHSVQGAA